MSAARAVGLLLGVVADSLAGDRRDGVAAVVRRPLRGDRPIAGALLLGGALLAGVAAERLGRRDPLLQIAGTALATWSTLGGAALAAEGAALARALDASDLPAARATLPRLTAHDPSTVDTLDGP